MENSDPSMPSTPSPSPTEATSKARTAAIAGGLLLIAAIAYIFVLHSQLSTLKSESSKTLEAHLKTIYLQTQQVDALDRLAVRIDRFNREFGASVGRISINGDIESSIQSLEQKAHVPEEAKKTLEEFEKSAAAIQEMSAKVKEYERFLGAPATVKRGDTHSQIVRAYLIDEAKLTPKEADEVLRKTALAWELEPGNQVFNLYHDGILLSTVTQGSAKRPPLMVQWTARHAILAHVQELEEKIRRLETHAENGDSQAAQPSKAVPNEGK